MITISDTPLENGALHIIAALEAKGFRAFIVGGYVRDKLLGREVYDIDIATSAHPDDVLSCFEHTIPTGLKHGTVTVLIDHVPYEVTTFRSEGTYSDSRRPDHVEFIDDVEVDLSRRDFTINAMALSRSKMIIDPFGGLSDLKERKLRCVGSPKERFEEDALRMVRAIRFAAEYELTIVDSSWLAIIQERPRMIHVALERVRVELNRMIEGSFPSRALELWIESELYNHLKRDLGISDEQWKQLNTYIHEAGQLDDPLLRWGWLWFRLNCSPRQASVAMKRLTFSNADRKLVETYLRVWNEFFQWNLQLAGIDESLRMNQLEHRWKKTVLSVGRQHSEQITNLLTILKDDELLLIKQALQEQSFKWVEEMPVHDIAELAIGGEEVSSLAPKKGPWIKEILDTLLEEAAIYGLSNDKKTLMERAKQLFILRNFPPQLISDVKCFQSLDSTQAEAQRWVSEEEDVEGGLVLAEQQTAGRGRQGKAWFSPAGKGIWLSLILRPRVPTKFHPQFTLLFSVAVCQVLRSTGLDVGIKWPNDILIDGKKIAGILLESTQGKDGYRYLICGVGISVNLTQQDFPQPIRGVATSVKEQLGKEADRTEILTRFLYRLEELLNIYYTEGFQPIKTMWEVLSFTIGQKIRVTEEAKTYHVLGLTEDGALRVRTESNQIQIIYSGEISHLTSD